MTTTEKYRDFILENFIGDSLRVQLPKIDEEGRHWITKLGLSTYIKVDIEVIEKYSRSFKVVLKFNGFEVEQLFFTPIESSPPSIKEKFVDRIEKLVVDTLGQEEIKRLNKEREEKVYSKIASAVKNLKNEI
jgi:hypothetical protein